MLTTKQYFILKQCKHLHTKILIKRYDFAYLVCTIIVQRKDALTEISKYLVADAYFSKKTFVDKILGNTDLHVISRFRKKYRFEVSLLR